MFITSGQRIRITISLYCTISIYDVMTSLGMKCAAATTAGAAAAPASLAGTATAPALAAGTAAESENQPVPVAVAPIEKKQHAKKSGMTISQGHQKSMRRRQSQRSSPGPCP